jgi:hypothetical protein
MGRLCLRRGCGSSMCVEDALSRVARQVKMVFPHSPPLSVTMNDGEVVAPRCSCAYRWRCSCAYRWRCSCAYRWRACDALRCSTCPRGSTSSASTTDLRSVCFADAAAATACMTTCCRSRVTASTTPHRYRVIHSIVHNTICLVLVFALVHICSIHFTPCRCVLHTNRPLQHAHTFLSGGVRPHRRRSGGCGRQ